MSVSVEQLASAIYAQRVALSAPQRTHQMVGWSDLSPSVRAAEETEAVALIALAPTVTDIPSRVAFYFR